MRVRTRNKTEELTPASIGVNGANHMQGVIGVEDNINNQNNGSKKDLSGTHFNDVIPPARADLEATTPEGVQIDVKHGKLNVKPSSEGLAEKMLNKIDQSLGKRGGFGGLAALMGLVMIVIGYRWDYLQNISGLLYFIRDLKPSELFIIAVGTTFITLGGGFGMFVRGRQHYLRGSIRRWFVAIYIFGMVLNGTLSLVGRMVGTKNNIIEDHGLTPTEQAQLANANQVIAAYEGKSVSRVTRNELVNKRALRDGLLSKQAGLERRVADQFNESKVQAIGYGAFLLQIILAWFPSLIITMGLILVIWQYGDLAYDSRYTKDLFDAAKTQADKV